MLSPKIKESYWGRHPGPVFVCVLSSYPHTYTYTCTHILYEQEILCEVIICICILAQTILSHKSYTTLQMVFCRCHIKEQTVWLLLFRNSSSSSFSLFPLPSPFPPFLPLPLFLSPWTAHAHSACYFELQGRKFVDILQSLRNYSSDEISATFSMHCLSPVKQRNGSCTFTPLNTRSGF